jgi:hypothetical protein
MQDKYWGLFGVIILFFLPRTVTQQIKRKQRNLMYNTYEYLVV